MLVVVVDVVDVLVVVLVVELVVVLVVADVDVVVVEVVVDPVVRTINIAAIHAPMTARPSRRETKRIGEHRLQEGSK